MTKPDFLVIGAQKAGTTWLYKHLRQHPDIWLPPVKEMHYFDRTKHPLILDAFRGRRQRFMLWRWLRPALRSRDNLGWHARFFLKSRSNDWYTRCFPDSDEVLCGDITPAYARLDEDRVGKVATLLPDVKIIYILRDPIERMWSQAAMYFSRYGHSGLENQSHEDVRRFLDWSFARANSDYVANIDRWQSHFSSDQIHLAFFDDLVNDPGNFLARTCDFLQVASPQMRGGLTDKVHAREYPEIPGSLLPQLCSEYLPMLHELNQRFGNVHTAAWIERAQRS